MRATWNGYFALGQLVLPVKLYSATKPDTPRFVQLHAQDHGAVSHKIVCLIDGQEIKQEDLIRAVKHGDTYVEISDDEMIRYSPDYKCITVRQFGTAESVNPIYYEKPYYIIPGDNGKQAYTLIRQALVKSKKAAVVTYVLYEKQRFGIIVESNGLLILHQLRFASEIVPRSDIKMPSLPQAIPAQVDAAIKLIERYTTPFYIDDYRNEQIEELNELIDRKAKGLPPKHVSHTDKHATADQDILTALQATLQAETKYLPTDQSIQ